MQETANPVEAQEEQEEGPSNQVLTFMLENEEYGVPIYDVKEICSYEETTPLPKSPSYLNGVMNMRGLIIPVVDLRNRFQFPHRPYDEATVIVILQQEVDSRLRFFGIVVDSISDVYSVDPEQQQPPPPKTNKVRDHFTSGIIAMADKLIFILDQNKLLFDTD